MSYSDLLPRRVQNSRILCQHLSSEGKRCTNVARIETTIHENPEHEDRWVTVLLCIKHSGEILPKAKQAK